MRTPGIGLRPGIKYSVKMYTNLTWIRPYHEHKGWEIVTLAIVLNA